ncbi:MAG: hypothetical protein AB8H80_09490 [Planctomycetota bacterium]
MSLFDWFFPEQAQASHLRKLTEQQRGSRRSTQRQNATVNALEKRIESLEQDLGFASLVLASVMAKLDEKGTVSRADIKAAMAEIDEIDGVADGRLDVNVLKGMQS